MMSKDAKASGAAKPALRGNVKLIGIAGLCKGEEFTIELGREVTIGRSRDCDICLRDVPRAKDLDDEDEVIQQHFNTVSRTHLKLTYHAPDNVELEDMSSNGLYVDGKRVDGSLTLTDLVDSRHEMKLGTHETFCIDWWRLLPRSEVKMVTVKVKKVPDPEESEAEAADGDESKDATNDDR